MKVKELYQILKSGMESELSEDYGEQYVAVCTDDNSVGPISSSEVVNGFPGFDWNSGYFLIHTKDKLIKK